MKNLQNKNWNLSGNKNLLQTIIIPVFLLLICRNLNADSPSWITSSKADTIPATWHCFRKTFSIDVNPDKAMMKIAVDTKCWLWINDSCVIYEGGVKRGPNPSDMYYDELDIAPFLKRGENTMSILVWYWGGKGFSHNSSGRCGLWLNTVIGDKSLNSDSSWKAMPHPAYLPGRRPKPNFRLSEPNICFDAGKPH